MISLREDATISAVSSRPKRSVQRAAAKVLLLLLGAGLLALGGCAGRLVLQPAAYETLLRAEPPRTLAAEAKGEPQSGSARPLPAGLRLQPAGRIPQGLVLRPVGREIVVFGEDREEAHVVVQGTRWVGYYLPFERGYLGLKEPVSLSLE